jgi:hypothetical protein
VNKVREPKLAVMCPGCDKPMQTVDYKPIMFSNGLADVTYRCETCAMTTVRTVRQDNDRKPARDLSRPG